MDLIEPRVSGDTREDCESSQALVNPLSGLANDYLNLFNELVMVLEQLPQMPELAEDLLAWRPVGYREHFERSLLPDRKSAIDAYDRLDVSFRKRFEVVVQDLDVIAVVSVAAVRRQFKHGAPDDFARTAATCERAAERLRIILARASRLVNHARLDEA